MSATDPSTAVSATLLRALAAMRDGDFSVRLPQDWVGVDAKIAETFNDIVSANARIAHELERVSRLVGRQGDATQRVRFGRSDGCWGEMQASVNTLVDDLIDLTRISLGVIGLQRERVAIATIVEQAVESTRAVLDARDHRLAVHVPAHGPDVFGDAARLAQVIGNLLTNAAKFTPPGGDITLGVTHEADLVVIRVSDTGVGIDPARLSHIFELFTQAGQPAGHNASGLGIGLALVRRIVDMHEGQVCAHSRGPGTGTEVTVRLPALRALPTLTQDLAPVPVTAETRPAPTGARILVVDDNADAAFMLALRLRHAGHTVETVGNGEQALRTGPTFDPRVILLDLGMPGMDGFETARRIRQQRWGQDVVLVAVTGRGLPEDRRRTQSAGFNAHLLKPVNDEELLSVLSNLLARPTA